MKTINFFLPVHNRFYFTKNIVGNIKQLQQVSSLKVKIWIIDDGSQDETLSWENNLHDEDIVVLRGDGNLWWGGSLNLILDLCRKSTIAPYDYVVILNNDCLLPENALEAIAHELSRMDNVVIQPTQYQVNDEYYEKLLFNSFDSIKNYLKPNYGMKFVSETFRFYPEEAPGLCDCINTNGLATLAKNLAKADLIPKEIRHYLSDYYLALDLYSKGCFLKCSEQYFIVWNHSTSRNFPIKPKNFFARLENSLDFRHPMYRPAWQKMRQRFSDESYLEVRIFKANLKTEILKIILFIYKDCIMRLLKMI